MDEILTWLAGNRNYEAGVKLYLQHGKEPLLLLLFKESWSLFKEAKLATALALLAEPCCDSCEHGDTCESEKPAADISAKLDELISENEELLEEKESLEEENYDLQEKVEELEAANDQLADDLKKLEKKAVNAPKGWPPVMDNITQQLYDEWKPLFLEKKNLQARIYDVALLGEKDQAKEKEAGAMAHKIRDLRDACRKIYQKRDYYLANQKLPDEEQELPNLVTDAKKHPKCLANHQRYLRDYKAKQKNAGTDAERERLQKNIDLQQRYVDYYKKMLD